MGKIFDVSPTEIALELTNIAMKPKNGQQFINISVDIRSSNTSETKKIENTKMAEEFIASLENLTRENEKLKDVELTATMHTTKPYLGYQGTCIPNTKNG